MLKRNDFLSNWLIENSGHSSQFANPSRARICYFEIILLTFDQKVVPKKHFCVVNSMCLQISFDLFGFLVLFYANEDSTDLV
jgi:hypothetical protein